MPRVKASTAFVSAFFVGIVLVLTGCEKKSNDPKAGSPVSSAAQSGPLVSSAPRAASELAPAIDGRVTLRPTFHYGKDDEQTTGTAFVILDREGTARLLTAGHLYRKDEWPTMRRVVLRSFADDTGFEVSGPPVHLGKYTEDTMPNFYNDLDLGEDLAHWPLPSGVKWVGLKLARNEPAKGDRVWLVGREVNHEGPQRLYPCKVNRSNTNMLYVKPDTRFDPEDFSGAPVVNSSGEVVGMLVGGTKLTGELFGASLPAL